MENNITDLLQGIDTIIVRVIDIDKSKKWYQELLGLSIVWDEPHMKLAVLDTKGPTSLTLWQTTKPISIDKDTASYPIFKTTDATALRAALQQVKIETGELVKDDYVTYFFFYDPDGNVLEACQVLA